MSVRRRGDSWMIDVVVWRGGERLRTRKSIRNITKAEAIALEREERRKLEQTRALTGKAPLFSEFAREFIETYAIPNNKPSEVQGKRSILRKHLLPFFGEMRLDAIGPYHIEKLKAHLFSQNLAVATVDNTLKIIRRLLKVAIEWGRLATMPTIRKLRIHSQKFDFLTFEEAKQLLAAADPEWRPMILIALRTGLRRGELLGLRWEDIDLVAGRLRVCRALVVGLLGTPKSGKTREIPLSDEAIAALEGLPSRSAQGFVFTRRSGKLLTEDIVRYPLERTCRRAGLRRIGWHVLRHTFASHLVMRGVPLTAVQELLGHSNIAMTMRYAHLTADVRRDAVRLLDDDHSLHGRSAARA